MFVLFTGDLNPFWFQCMLRTHKARLDNPLSRPESEIAVRFGSVTLRRAGAPDSGCQRSNVVRRAKQGASYQVKDLMFQNLASRNYRVLQ